jgi:hypothetical protein
MRTLAPGRVARRAAVLAVLTLVAAGVARAQSPPPVTPPAATAPNERAAAREFSFAAYRLRVAFLAQRTALRSAARRGIAALDDPLCGRAVDAAPDGRAVDVILTAAILALTPLWSAERAPLAQFLSELERVPTADPVLRSGRAGWRVEIETMGRLSAPADVCGALDAWRRLGFAPAAAPVDLRVLDARGLSESLTKRVRAAVRMVRLGVGLSAARRFTGLTLTDGIVDDAAVEEAGRRALSLR